MANTVLNLVDLDFNKYKETLRTYAKQQALFKDYDFDGSNMSVLNDILAYNTYHNAFYLNMVFAEMFLDSAQLRNSIASHAKDLNYLPRSFRSAKATVDISIVTDEATTSVVIPKNQPFSTRVNSKTYQFVTAENVVITEKSENVFTAKNVEIFEGVYSLDTFYVNYAIERQRFVLSNPTIDTSSLTVVVSDDSSSKTYRLATSFLDLDSNSEVFFLQAAEGDKYEIIFGNGVIGKRPKNGATIYAEYRICSGELPNGAFEFTNDRNIGPWGDVTITTQLDSEGNIKRATGGTVHETLDEVRFNAPRHYQTQERAITVNDYKIMLQNKFPEINAIAVYGGEKQSPPQYGRVFVVIDLFGFDGIPQYKKDEYKKWLSNRIPVTIEPIFLDPTFAFGSLNLTINYNQNKTDLSTADISTRVIGTVVDYSAKNFNDFNVVTRFSKLITAIDDTHPSILSSAGVFRIYKTIKPTLNVTGNITIDFAFPLKRTLPKIGNVHPSTDEKVVTSSVFVFDGKKCRLEDDNNGVVRVVQNTSDRTISVVKNIGRINYNTGKITLSNFITSGYDGNQIKVYVLPRTNDVDFGRSDYFEIKTEDISVNVIGVRE
jgi:hypothetical protein